MDKAALLAPRLDEEDVPLPGVGVVRVRALSREDVLALARRDVPDGAPANTFECRLLAAALVDPVLTEDEVAVWQRGAKSAELSLVVGKVNDLAGLNDGSAKDAYKEFDADPASEFRVLPRAEARDDGDADAGGDA